MSNILNKNVNQINGPINVVRMEGTVNNIIKTIYIFMDLHEPCEFQTECDNIFSKDIREFLADSFSKLNNSYKMYDFFLEIFPTELQNIKYGYNIDVAQNSRDIYLSEVRKFFRKLFNYDPKENKVSVSNYFKNIRLHYIDIRDYFGLHLYDRFQDIMYVVDSILKNGIHLDKLKHLINFVEEFKNYFVTVKDIISAYKTSDKKPAKKFSIIKYQYLNKEPNGKNTAKKQITPEQKTQIDFDNMYYIINKVFSSYKNEDVQKLLSKQIGVLEEDLDDLIAKSQKIINAYINIGDTINVTKNKLTKNENPTKIKYYYGLSNYTIRDMSYFIVNSMSILFHTFVVFFSQFMDIYFLRRFLDKEYITNAITYTGAAHSATYISILAKDFDFRITHVAHSTIEDIDELNKKIRETNAEDYPALFYPEVRNQCSDISHFPQNFE